MKRLLVAGAFALALVAGSQQSASAWSHFKFGVGLNFTIGRTPIGASDYALQRYTDDETANDTSLGSFSITRARSWPPTTPRSAP